MIHIITCETFKIIIYSKTETGNFYASSTNMSGVNIKFHLMMPFLLLSKSQTIYILVIVKKYYQYILL